MFIQVLAGLDKECLILCFQLREEVGYKRLWQKKMCDGDGQ